MNKRKIFTIIIVLAVIAVLVTVISGNLRSFVLKEKYPELAKNSKFEAQIYLDDNSSIEAKLVGRDILNILASAEVKKGRSFDAVPSPAFELRFSSISTGVYVCGSGDICIFRLGNPDGTMKFYCDEGRLFEALYKAHLNRGGIELP